MFSIEKQNKFVLEKELECALVSADWLLYTWTDWLAGNIRGSM